MFCVTDLLMCNLYQPRVHFGCFYHHQPPFAVEGSNSCWIGSNFCWIGSNSYWIGSNFCWIFCWRPVVVGVKSLFSCSSGFAPIRWYLFGFHFGGFRQPLFPVEGSNFWWMVFGVQSLFSHSSGLVSIYWYFCCFGNRVHFGCLHHRQPPFSVQGLNFCWLVVVEQCLFWWSNVASN